MSRPSVGVVLGAGGIIGHAWHAGVLAGIQEVLGWDAREADLLVGTSAGSVVATMLRAGISPTDLHASSAGGAVSADGRRAFAQAGMALPQAKHEEERAASRLAPASPGLLVRTALRPWRVRPGLFLAGGLPRGRMDTSSIGDAARRLHDGAWPEQPLWLCTVRLDDGRRVVLGRDPVGDVDLGLAVEASCAIPGYFSPVLIGGVEHVDGGAHSTTNADVVAGCGLDVVLVSAPMSLDRSALRRPRADRLARIGHRLSVERELAVLRRRDHARVVTLQPGPADLDVLGPTAMSMDRSRRRRVAEQARETTVRRLRSNALRDALEPLRS